MYSCLPIPTMVFGQKQLRPYPSKGRAAIVHEIVVTGSLRKRRQCLRNSVHGKKLLTIFNVARNRVPSEKSSSSMAAKHKRFESKYASLFSTKGREELTFDSAASSKQFSRALQRPESSSQHSQIALP